MTHCLRETEHESRIFEILAVKQLEDAYSYYFNSDRTEDDRKRWESQVQLHLPRIINGYSRLNDLVSWAVEELEGINGQYKR